MPAVNQMILVEITWNVEPSWALLAWLKRQSNNNTKPGILDPVATHFIFTNCATM